MNVGTKREIHRQYVALLRAREAIGTVADLAESHGLTRQRLHQIVREVETDFAGLAQQRENKRDEKRTDKKEAAASPRQHS